MALCKICNLRRPRRFCPGVGGDICSICCGTEREVTVDCPFDCEYLIDSRIHERLGPAGNPPNEDIKVSERFLRENDLLVAVLGRAVLRAGLSVPGALDSDVREALEALIRTYRTLDSGLYYETRPDNPIAARIAALVQEDVAEYRRQEQERSGMASSIRDSAILGVLAFLQRAELLRNNGRKRSRSYLHFLYDNFPEPETPTGEGASLIVP